MELEKVTGKIFEVRGKKVMLDRDVAVALGVETKQLNQNAERSPKWEFLRDKGIESQYRFQLNEEELVNLNRSQIVTTSKYSSQLPWVYTELGCAYFGTSLTSEEACMLAVQLSRTFVSVRNRRSKLIDGDRQKVKSISLAEKYIKSSINIARMLGCTPSTARALSVQKTSRDLGVDVKDYLIENVSDVQDRLATPTEIGQELNMLAREVNQRLSKAGYQVKTSCGWGPTSKGSSFCQILDVGKKHSDGVPVRQVKWYMNKILSQDDWKNK